MSARRVTRILLALLLVALGWVALEAAWLEPSSLRISTYAVAQSLPALRGLRVAVISDLHAGAPFIDTAKIERVVAMTNAAKPDLILLAGDYVTTSVLGGYAVPAETVAANLKALRAPLGVYAVMGNHDRVAGADSIPLAFQRAGIPMLENARVMLPSPWSNVALIGLGSRASGLAIGGAFQTGVTGPALCFVHSPDVFPRLPSTCAMTIAGHTHGGQIRLPIVGRPAVASVSHFGQRYAIGVIRDKGKTLFVSPGIGTSILPLRFGVPPEISLLTLR